MKVFQNIEEIKNIKSTMLALGNFDGVHKGHQELIRRAVKSAKMAGLKSGVFTFANHPKNVIAGKPLVKNILYPEDKAELIRSMGVDYLFSLEFTSEIRRMTPQCFIEDLLIQKLKLKEAYCGFNYRFGYRGNGNPENLMHAGLKAGFGIHVLEPFYIDENLVSSSFIRELISDGKVEQCEKYLGRKYYTKGEVVKGNQIGRTIGFPTSNILIDESMVTPAHGVYVTCCTYNGVAHKSVTNVGIKPTVGKNEKTIETHIFDFDKELYGKEIRIEFLERIRAELKFDNFEELKAQIQKDCLVAKAYNKYNG